MSDFISRQAVMNYLREQQAGIIIEKTKQNAVTYEACKGMESSIEAFMNFINQVPAAYDPDKVIEALHRRYYTTQRERVHTHGLCKAMDNMLKAEADAYENAIEIVKAGGTDE